MHATKLVCVVLVAAAASKVAGEEPRGGGEFARDVLPIFVAQCVTCHGPEKQENGLRLDHGAAILRGGDSGPAVVAGKAAESLLVQALLGTNESVSRMPLKKEPLSEVEIAVIRRWIDAGANVPASSTVAPTKSKH